MQPRRRRRDPRPRRGAVGKAVARWALLGREAPDTEVWLRHIRWFYGRYSRNPYAGESIVFMPDRPVVVPGPGVEHVDLYAESNIRGRLMITTASEPQGGQLVRLHFGDRIQGDDLIVLSPEAAEDGDSLAAYGLAAGALEPTGFAIFLATAPRPSTRYAVRYALIRT